MWSESKVDLLDSSHEALQNGVYFPAELKFTPS
jgi:hypothetical protein